MIIFFLISTIQSCEFKQEDHFYNLTSLHKNEPYTVRTSADSSFFKMAYQFNFCGNHPSHCQGQSAAYEMIEVMGMLTDSCEMIGKPENQEFIPIENGLQITYSQGSNCENNNKKKVNFKIYCSQFQDNNFSIENSDKCTTNFFIKSPSGCKVVYATQPLFIYYLSATGIIIMILGMIFGYQQTKKNKKEEKNDQQYEKLNTDSLEKQTIQEQENIQVVNNNEQSA